MMVARQRYLDRHGVVGPWRINGAEGDDFTAVVVIPACDEEDWLFRTLDSLADNSPAALRQTLILVVLNHTQQTSAPVQAANLRTLAKLKSESPAGPLQLAWIDAVSAGFELPIGGAGAARRLGFDRALERLAGDDDPLLICLDADTLVEPTYLDSLQQHFASSRIGGAVVPFRHQPASSSRLEAAITRYELYLRCYVLGMQLAGSPYAFHTIGSAIACRASAYVGCGGMPQRQAGEDFYFLQNLAKTAGVSSVRGTCVHPAARVSDRVPFGTGPTLSKLQTDPESQLFYPLEAFLLLGEFLQLAIGWTGSGEGLQQQVNQLNPVLGHFFQEQKLERVIDRLRRNNTTQSRFEKAFHGWFDGLKSLRLLRRLCDGSPFKMVSAEEAAPALLHQAGMSCDVEVAQMLDVVRFEQNNR